MKNEKEIGLIVRKLRGDMSLRDFANKCDISHTTIDNIEKGIDFRTGKPVQVKINTLQKIADACGVPLSYITDEEEEMSREEELKIALFGGDITVTDEMWEMVKDYAKLIKQRYKQKAERDKMMYTSSRLRLAMLKKDIYAPDLAKQTGLTWLRISSFIDGLNTPLEEEAKVLADALEISADWLLCRIDMNLEDALLKYAKEPVSESNWKKIMDYVELLESNGIKTNICKDFADEVAEGLETSGFTALSRQTTSIK